MLDTSIRGHLIELHGTQWVYADTGEAVDWENERPCAKCGEPPTPEGYDACTGHVIGATSACCGHGDPEHYIGKGG